MMRKIAIIAVSCLLALLLSGCFSPYAGDTGTITISVGGSAGRGAVWPDGNGGGELHLVEHHITLNGPSGAITRTVKGGNTMRFSVVPGVWQVTVKDTLYGMDFATGVSEPFEVKAGQNEPARIMMKSSGTSFYVINNDWDDTVDLIKEGKHCIILTHDFEAKATTFVTMPAGSSRDVLILGNGHSITLSEPGSLLSIGGNNTVTIQNVHLKGNTTNTSSVVTVNGGTFIMESGTISGNTATNGGGVIVNTNGTFTMDGGEIYDNKADNGGGVYVNSGAFTMNNGKISDNTASGGGGGVVVNNGGTFTMSSGEISGNEATYGGGVYVGAGDFTMSGGEIYDNTATNGGGVYVSGSGTFRMSSGEISNSNIATTSGAALCLISGGTATYGTAASGGTSVGSILPHTDNNNDYTNNTINVVNGEIQP